MQLWTISPGPNPSRPLSAITTSSCACFASVARFNALRLGCSSPKCLVCLPRPLYWNESKLHASRTVDQFELASPPFDSVSSVRFSPTNPSHLLVSSWDTVSHVRSHLPGCVVKSGSWARVDRQECSIGTRCEFVLHNLTCSISQTVRFYDVATNEQKSKYDHRAAVLACCFSDATHGFSGGLDTSVREYVVSTQLQLPSSSP